MQRSLSAIFRKHRWILPLCILIAIWVFPQSYRFTKLLSLALIGYLLFSLIVVFRRRKTVILVMVGIVLSFSIFLALPGRAPDTGRLRDLYLECLNRYAGTFYFWGGENRIGIDCSGLVRNGLIDANLQLGFMTANPNPIREAIDLWWHDCSAQALQDGYRGFTTFLFASQNINSITNETLMKGDIAVTKDGVHVMAYLGDDKWIEADPSCMRVVLEDIPTDNPWFMKPVHVLRWNQLKPVPNQNHQRTAVPRATL